MKAYQITEWGQPLEERDVPIPEPKGGEVLIKVTACGICHSDIHIWDGFFDMGGGKRLNLSERGLALPFTMGHEALGEVAWPGRERCQDRRHAGRLSVDRLRRMRRVQAR
jgi:propanol-preferring alcohol dehydrogenase